MPPTTEQLLAVLHAASTLLERRADQMLTNEEWDALDRAVANCGLHAQPATQMDAPTEPDNR